MGLSQNELLQFALENGMIDLDKVQEQVIMEQRKKFIQMHPYKVWISDDGKWHTHFVDENGKRKRKDRKTKKEIEDLIVEYYSSQQEFTTIEDVFNEWNDRRLEIKKISAATHLRNRQTYNRHYQSFGKKDIERVIPEQFLDFLEEEVSTKNLKAKAYGNLKGITRGFLKYAKRNKLIYWNVEEMLDDVDISDRDFAPSIKEDCYEVFDEDELPKMIDYCCEHKEDIRTLAVLLAFVTGCRVGEIVTLKYDDFIYENTAFTVKRTETRYQLPGEKEYHYDVKDFPKTQAGYRNVIIPESFQWIYKQLRKLNPFGNYVFVNENGERLHTHHIRRKMYRMCNKLEIVRKSPHKARKTYGTILLDNNINSKLIEGQMGHADILVTELHYHRNRKDMMEKQRIINSIPEFDFKSKKAL